MLPQNITNRVPLTLSENSCCSFRWHVGDIVDHLVRLSWSFFIIKQYHFSVCADTLSFPIGICSVLLFFNTICIVQTPNFIFSVRLLLADVWPSITASITITLSAQVQLKRFLGLPIYFCEFFANLVVTNGIKLMNWPAKSPDLNITESIWGVLARKV